MKEQSRLILSVSGAASFYKGLEELFQSPLREAPSFHQEGPLLAPDPSNAALQDPGGLG